MARNDVVNRDGSINYDTIGGFKDRLDGHDSSLAEITQYSRTLDSFKTTSNTWDQALQSAFSYFGSKGGQILLGANVYILSPFTMPERISIKGLGRSISILQQLAGTIGHFITFNQNSLFSRLQDLTIDGDNTYNPNGGDGIYFNTVTAGTEANAITDNTDNNPSNATYNTIENIIVINAKQNGIEINSAYWGTFFNKIIVRNSGNHGIWCKDTDLFFDTIQTEFNQHSGIFDQGGNNRWSNIKSIFNGQADTANSAGFILYNANRNLMVNIECQDNYCDGFQMTNGSSHIIDNLMLDANGRIYNQADPTNGTMSGDTNRTGLRITNSKNFTIKGITSNYTYPNCYIQNNAAIIDTQSTNYSIDLKQINQYAASTTILSNAGATSSRPANPIIGQQFYDTTLNKPIFCKVGGSSPTWTDATGSTV